MIEWGSEYDNYKIFKGKTVTDDVWLGKDSRLSAFIRTIKLTVRRMDSEKIKTALRRAACRQLKGQIVGPSRLRCPTSIEEYRYLQNRVEN